MSAKLNNARVLVVGGSFGIGPATAAAASETGAQARRVSQPEDIANAVMFLVTTLFATASTVSVDGGGGSQRHTLRSASGSSAPDRSTGDPWTNNEEPIRCEAKTDRSSVDLPHQMIFGNRIAEMKLVEQLTLVTLQTAHHGSTSSRFASTLRNHASWPLSTDFCNKIGAKRSSMSANVSQTPLLRSYRLATGELRKSGLRPGEFATR